MKTIYKYIISAAMLLGGIGGTVAQDGRPSVSVTCNDLKQIGDSLYIDAVIHISGEAVKSTRSLALTPVLEAPTQKMGLPSILLLGKKSAKVYSREKALNNLKEDEPRFAIINTAQTTQQTLPYKMTVTYEPWMKDARFVLAEDLCGCGKSEPGSPLLIADKIRLYPTERYQVQPVLAYIVPEAETEKHRAEVGTAYLDFQVNKWDILPDYHNNAAELAKIDNTITAVVNDKNITPQKIVLKGYASPEGSYANNARLAENRVKSLRDYIRNKHDFAQSFFTVESEPEDWAGFKAKVEADPNVPSRDEVLAIIASDDTPDKKESRLKGLNRGVPYQYVLKEIFPYLRHSDYRIDYTVRFFTVEEGREIIKTRPGQLSLSEMFAVANSYEIGSEDYNQVFDIAVRTYSDDPVANLNAANIAIMKGNYDAARNYLAKAGNSPEAIHARGILYLIEGNLDAAEPLLKQAKVSGIKEAEQNLNELKKKKENNELFDSFTH
ncbi:DUF3868 domain-containing protein [Parabacteroides pacaensis]|uniref:DUF3868 domain-containing protein n=1 Tax=Parabacteroides pacaensis TaxID=2086575 RepID=UPI000D1137C5|nr:DUF3868 domain-containing protein [Parabacteroides pacaensis]